MAEISSQAFREIIQQGAAQIARRVASGELSAAEVAEAHIRRIEEVNGLLNAVVVPCFNRARREASEVDRRRRAGEPLGPLAGVPITVKECFYVADSATIGVERSQVRFPPPIVPW